MHATPPGPIWRAQLPGQASNLAIFKIRARPEFRATRTRIVVAVPPSAPAGRQAMGVQESLPSVAGVQTSSVGMNDHRGLRISPPNRPQQSVDGRSLIDPRAHRSTERLAREQVLRPLPGTARLRITLAAHARSMCLSFEQRNVWRFRGDSAASPRHGFSFLRHRPPAARRWPALSAPQARLYPSSIAGGLLPGVAIPWVNAQAVLATISVGLPANNPSRCTRSTTSNKT